MINPTSRWQRSSSPSAAALIARSLLGPDMMSAGSLRAHATEPDLAEPLHPDDTDPVDQPDVDPAPPEDPVPGEDDDQDPAPR